MSEDVFGKPRDNEEIVIDGLDEVDESPWYVPPGEYEAQVTDVVNAPSKAGDPMLKFVFTITTRGPANGKDLSTYCVMKKSAMWRLKQAVAALGFDVAQKQLRFSPTAAIGRKATLVVEDQEYEGQKRSNIKSVKPL